ncbi:MAG: ABC transporter ATP-binding protein [Deferribacterales bacterium]|nr:ABC transporter ATP-binding protein [Deferribacterales bacterium]
MITVTELHKSFKGQEVLRGVDLTVDDGEKIMLLGRNGAGKTTLIRCMLGEYRPSSGSVVIDGVSPWDDRVSALKHISFVPQLPPPIKFTISELIDYSSGISGFDKNLVIENCRKLELDIEPHLGKGFHKLSGGMKQKVLISIAFARNTKTIIFDEPTANLDISGRETFRRLLDEAGESKTYIFISHRLEEFDGLASRAVELDLGRIVKNDKI